MNSIRQRMQEIAKRPFRKIKVKEHLAPGQHPTPLHCLQASRIVADELTVRLSRRCYEIEQLPFGIGKQDFAQQVVGWYTQTCKELFQFTDEVEELRRSMPTRSWPEQPTRLSSLFFGFGQKKTAQITTGTIAPLDQDLKKMYEFLISVFGSECTDPILSPMATSLTSKLFHILERAVARHKPIMLLTAQEVNRQKFSKMDDMEVQKFLTRFHWQRIAVRLLIGHCVALSKPLPLDNMIGIFCTKTPIEEIVIESINLAEEMCLLTYGCVPTVEISCTPNRNDLLYIPSHLQHIIFELMKNAMRAVIEKEQVRVGNDGVIKTKNLPPIVVHWDNSPKQCLFEIRDEGVGIPKDIVEDVFLFHYTTAERPKDEITVMAGYGYGLPLSRLYARFLKGDIWLQSEEGKGTSVFVNLKGTWESDELI
jgi:pyruvate dehydrogenase kinase 2/3/4